MIQQAAQAIFDEVVAIETSAKLARTWDQLSSDAKDSCKVIRSNLGTIAEVQPRIAHEISNEVLAIEIALRSATHQKQLAADCADSCTEIRIQLSKLNHELKAEPADV